MALQRWKRWWIWSHKELYVPTSQCTIITNNTFPAPLQHLCGMRATRRCGCAFGCCGLCSHVVRGPDAWGFAFTEYEARIHHLHSRPHCFVHVCKEKAVGTTLGHQGNDLKWLCPPLSRNRQNDTGKRMYSLHLALMCANLLFCRHHYRLSPRLRHFGLCIVIKL